MPELPEVEVVRGGLQQGATGRRVASVTVSHPRAVRRHTAGEADFAARLAGRRIEAVHRRGKYLWMPLDSPDALLVHLGMSGQLVMATADVAPHPHLRVRMCFDDGGAQLWFADQRTFGGMWLAEAGAQGTHSPEVPTPIAHIARDPLDESFDEESIYRSLRRRRTGLKRALLDQSLVGGIGNIYADEALWRARLHWARPTETLTRAETARVVAALREVLRNAVTAGGTSFDGLYVNVNGESGYFEPRLAVYGREAFPCSRCGAPVRRDMFMNRSAYSCPRCQPRPRRARW